MRVSTLLLIVASCWINCGIALAQQTAAAVSQAADPDEQAIRTQSQRFVEFFNAGKAADLLGLFLPKAELMDDQGNTYRGAEEIRPLLEGFFAKFPGSKSTHEVESIRLVSSSVAIEDGVRTVTRKDPNNDHEHETRTARNRYTIVYVKQDNAWQIASAREYVDDEPTPHERLEPLAWLVGSWVDEGTDAVMQMTCRWSEDTNYLLADYDVRVAGKPVLKSNQRIGWDPLTQKVHSWFFDSDGGRGEGVWTLVDDRWIVKTTVVLPDGSTGSATVYFQPVDADKYVMTGLDRVRGDVLEADYEVTVVRKPPQPSSQK